VHEDSSRLTTQLDVDAAGWSAMITCSLTLHRSWPTTAQAGASRHYLLQPSSRLASLCRQPTYHYRYMLLLPTVHNWPGISHRTSGAEACLGSTCHHRSAPCSPRTIVHCCARILACRPATRSGSLCTQSLQLATVAQRCGRWDLPFLPTVSCAQGREAAAHAESLQTGQLFAATARPPPVQLNHPWVLCPPHYCLTWTPCADVNVTAITNTSLAVSFTQPDINAAFHISNCSIVRQPCALQDVQSCVVCVTATDQCTVSSESLAPGTTYTFSGYCENAMGPGVLSSPSVAVTVPMTLTLPGSSPQPYITDITKYVPDAAATDLCH
jgi:hypothetical protein